MSDDAPERVAALESSLDYHFTDHGLLLRALTHSSFANECAATRKERFQVDNERLEFLGDAVLQITVSEWLFEEYPRVAEGRLTQRRSAIVNADALATVAGTLALGALLRIGVGEERSGGRERASNLADALEALLGAVFLDGGFDAARAVVRRIFAERVSEVSSGTIKGPKSRLQEWTQAQHHVTPEYELIGSVGPAHAASFLVEVRVLDVVTGKGEGRSKQDAEKAAARHALEQLELS